MPSLEQNKKHWEAYDWSLGGEEWSQAFGGSQAIWRQILLPRIGRFLPTGHILEIASGYGRMTQYLLGVSEELTGVDICSRAVQSCRERFASVEKARFFEGDGTSLSCVADGSVDFVFSWDSLVHAEQDILDAYVVEIERKLRPGGIGFLHHSNIADLPPSVLDPETGNAPHWRGTSGSGTRTSQACEAAGLRCLVQEQVPWGVPDPIDCFTLFVRPEAGRDYPEFEVSLAKHFGVEIQLAHRLASLYLGVRP